MLGQIDEWDSKHRTEQMDGDGDGQSQENGAEEKKIPDWEKTALKPYVEYFRAFVNGLLKEEGRGKRDREEGGDPMEF